MQNELQHHLEVRGLDKNGNKVELASRLLDNLVNQVRGGCVLVCAVLRLLYCSSRWCGGRR